MQNFEKLNHEIREKFKDDKAKHPDAFKDRLALSWSNWGFGIEPLEDSVRRLKDAGLEWIELHGNHYGDDLGYDAERTMKILEDYGVRVSGICGMFSEDNDLSSNRGIQRQAALDYIRRELRFGEKVGAHYMLVVPGAVGRPAAYDTSEFHRSVETLQLVADQFVKANIKAAIEPIRSAEVSFVHTVADAKAYIDAVGHPGVRHINGDVYHMQSEEVHIPSAILEAGEQLTNLHMADSNRRALGEGSLDLDTIIMALYLIRYNRPGCFVTPEPLGPGGDPYPAMNAIPDPEVVEHLVRQTITYFRAREDAVLAL